MSFASYCTIAALLAFACSALVIGVLLRTGIAWKLATDIPNARSLHVRPTPRVGGIAVTPVSALGIVCFARPLWWLALLALCLGVLSVIDDRRGLPARVRFVGHIAAAIAIVVAVGFDHPWLAALIVIALVWLCNLYNFMDGANGLAGGMAVLGFAGYAFAAGAAHSDVALASTVVAAAAAGFLLFNFPNARVFLGDVGSIPLGFLVGGLGYWGYRAGAWGWWFPVFVFAPFIADASVTLFRRACRGEKVWQAHREHYYQRMIGMAGSHHPVVLRWYAAMICGIFLACFATRLPGGMPYVVLAGWFCFLAILGLRVDRQWRRAPAY